MKKTNFTNLSLYIRGVLSILFAIGFYASVGAQCSLVCNGGVNLSLDGIECEVELQAEDFINGEETTCDGGIFDIHILDHHGNLLNEDGIIYHSYAGQTLQYKVLEESGNSCWGYITVEDKEAPVIDCTPEQGPFYCYDLPNFNVKERLLADCNDTSDIVITLIGSTEQFNDCQTYGADTLSMITRTYIATDPFGNVSDPCTFTFFVERIPDLSVVQFPVSLLKNTGNPLQCDYDYPLDDDGFPSPIGDGMHEGTGVPYFMNGMEVINLYPTDGTFCNLLVDYDDRIIADNGCVLKIMRTWTLIEWSCEAEQRTREVPQVIEIVDDEGPELTAPDDLTVSTSDHDCAGNPYIPPVFPVDACDDEELRVDLSWTGGIPGFIPDFDGAHIRLDTGHSVLTFVAYDACGNSSTDVMEVWVEDHTPPVAICDQFTVVSLTTDGTAWVHASVFDDGSYDECKLDRMEVRRMGADECDEDDDGDVLEEDDFDEYVKFCCSDIGNDDLMVVFRVYDKAGNYNDCMVNVEIQDKLPPMIVCPPDLTVQCGIDYANLDDFGTVRTSPDLVEDIVIAEEYYIGHNGGVGALKDGYATDNCIVMVSEDPIEEINQCNRGVITRIFTATDAGNRTAQCVQTIYITDQYPFEFEDIYWPRDTTLEGCLDPTSSQFHPDEVGYPTFDEDECDLVGSSYEDHVFPFNNSEGDACFKILRKWKVIDWCQFEERKENGFRDERDYTWTRTQVIKVNNTFDPIILGDYDRLSVCTYDPDCSDGFIDLSANATDDCTEDLKASYQIDANNDGSFDIFSVDVIGTQIGNSISAAGTYPVGSHRIVWTFEDLCGNKTSIEQLFDIVNCKAPTPYCINGLAVDLMPVDPDGDGVVDGGMVQLWATDFDAGSFHTCEGYEVILSFSADTTHKSMDFDCTHVGEQQVTIYASVLTPMNTLVQAFCITTLDVQDNMMACDGAGGMRVGINGTIATEDARTVEEASVALEGSELQDAMTNADGLFAFPNMPTGGTYAVIPEKEDNPVNGVSTLDLVMIQRHILGVTKFDSPYKMIAADINGDNKLSASDLIEMRKLILGINDKFNSNTSWRFVDKNFNFENAETALDSDYPQVYDISTLEDNMIIDFVGVKIGDVNNNAAANRFDRVNTRSNGTLSLNADNQLFDMNASVSIDIKASDATDLVGMQATFALDPSMVSVTGVTGGVLDINDSNYNLSNSENGFVTMSWNNTDAVAIEEGEVLFTIDVQALNAGSISNTVSVINNPLTAEAYTSPEDVVGLELVMNSLEGGEFALLQNAPNPFSESTEVGFVLPENMNVTFTVYDVTGKTIKVLNDYYNAGQNTIRLTRSELNTNGVVYYQIEAGNYIATKKMVILN